jgi:hypothetical protein
MLHMIGPGVTCKQSHMHPRRFDLNSPHAFTSLHLRPRPRHKFPRHLSLVTSTSRYLEHDFHPRLTPFPSPTSASTPANYHDDMEHSQSQSHNSLSPPPSALTPPTRHTTALKIHRLLSQTFTKDPTSSTTMANLDQATVSQDQTHPAIHQICPGSSLSPITSAEKEQGFEAVTAVLEINELLHLIIKEVPLKYRASFLEVSKSWNAAVTKIGYTLEPVSYKLDLHHLAAGSFIPRFIFGSRFSHSGFHGLPMLPSTAEFEMHSAFPEDKSASGPVVFSNVFFPDPTAWTRVGDSRNGLTVYYQGFVPLPIAPELAGHEHEYISSPPLTHVMMSMGRRGDNAAILRIREGIRIGDLMEYQKKMLPNAHYPDIWWSFGQGSAGGRRSGWTNM